MTTIVTFRVIAFQPLFSAFWGLSLLLRLQLFFVQTTAVLNYILFRLAKPALLQLACLRSLALLWAPIYPPRWVGAPWVGPVGPGQVQVTTYCVADGGQRL